MQNPSQSPHTPSSRWTGVSPTKAVVALILLLLLLGSAVAVFKLAPGLAHKAALSGDGAAKAASLQPLYSLNVTNLDSAAWSPDARTLADIEPDRVAYGLDNNRVKFWDGASGRLLHNDSVVPRAGSLLWSPDGSVVAASGKLTNTLSLIDPATGRVVRTLTVPLPEGMPAKSSRGLPFVGFYFDKTLLGWTYGGRELLTLTRTVARDGRSADGRGEANVIFTTVQVWDVSSSKLLRDITVRDSQDRMGLAHAALSPDGRMLALESEDGFSTPGKVHVTVELWDTAIGKVVATSLLEGDGPLNQYSSDSFILWSPDGQLLAVPLGRRVALLSRDGGRVERTLPEHLPPTATPPPTPDARLWPPPGVGTRPVTLVPAPPGTAGMVVPREVPSQAPPGYTPPPTATASPTPTANPNAYGLISSLAWSPEGATLAVYDADSLRFWNPSNGELRSITRHALQEYPRANGLAYSSDGSLLASIDTIEPRPYNDSYANLTIWDAHTGVELRELTAGVDTFSWAPVGLGMLVIYRNSAPRSMVWGPAIPGVSPSPGSKAP